MKKITFLTSLALGLLLGGSLANAEETDHEVTVGAQYYGIQNGGDEGRFREDWFMKDKFIGGVESLYFDSEKFDMDLKAIGHNEYKIKAVFKKPDFGYVKIDGQWARRYFDGSNEGFDPHMYNLTGAEVIPDNRNGGTIDDGFYSPEDFVDRADQGIHADRMDVTLELGLTIPDYPLTIAGYHRWSRFGKELLLRGERLRPPNDPPTPRLRAIGALASINGVSDLYYLDISKLIRDEHTLRLRHETEYYRDEQKIDFPRYKQTAGAGAIDQYRTFDDTPKFKTHTTYASVDTQVNENTLVSGAYAYGHLNNSSQREVIRPNRTGTGINHSIDTVTENIRRNHATTLGIRKAKVMGVKHLSLIGGARFERIDTNSNTSLLQGGDPTKRRVSRSTFDENRFVERLELRFRGWDKTSASFKVRLEQRDIAQAEWADLSAHEMVDPTHFASGIPIHDYKAGITHRNEEYGVKVVNRSLPVKVTAGLKYKQKDRNYNVTLDTDPRFYPGRFGNMNIQTKEANIGISKIIGKRGSAGLKYSYRDEDITTGAAGNGPTQDWQINRISGNLGGAPTDKLFLLATVVYEKYQLNTPTDISDTASVGGWAYGTARYDYTADYTTGMLDAEYAFTDNVKGMADYHITDTLGRNGYLFQRAGLGTSVKVSKATTIGLGGEYFSFEDHGGAGSFVEAGGGGGFDDYRGYGIKTTYSYAF